MYREIVTPTNQRHIIEIPKEYLNQEIEILVLPFFYYKKKKKREIEIENIDPMIELQLSSMKKTWDNSEDEAWDEL